MSMIEKYYSSYKIIIIIWLFVQIVVIAQDETKFINSLHRNLRDKKEQFKIEYKGNIPEFLNKLGEVTDRGIKKAKADRIFLESIETSVTYTSEHAIVNYDVKYKTMRNNYNNTYDELIPMLKSKLISRDKNISFSVNTNDAQLFMDGFGNLMKEAVKQTEKSQRNVVLVGYESSFMIYESYIEVKLNVDYLEENRKSDLFCFTKDEYVDIIFDKLNKRETKFIIHFLGNVSGERFDGETFSQSAYKRSSYLENNLDHIESSIRGFEDSYSIEYNVKYLTTAFEEDEISKYVKSVLDTLIKPGMDDFEIEKKIHDHIIEKTKYDKNKNNNSAHNAIFRGYATCHGYSLIAQKYFDEAGIESLIITSPEMDHAWNLVKILDDWYHIDFTWDDPLPDKEGRVLYTFYNLTAEEMLNHPEQKHFWDSNKYPAALKKFDRKYKPVNP